MRWLFRCDSSTQTPRWGPTCCFCDHQPWHGRLWYSDVFVLETRGKSTREGCRFGKRCRFQPAVGPRGAEGGLQRRKFAGGGTNDGPTQAAYTQ